MNPRPKGLHAFASCQLFLHGARLVSASAQAYSLTCLTEIDDLLAFLLDADVRLVRGAYLQELHAEGRPLPRRQEAELERTRAGREALLSHEEIAERLRSPRSHKRFAVIAVSHCWEAREHPDPARFQLGIVADALSGFPAFVQQLIPNRYHHLEDDWEAALFIDYVSLHQFRRNEEEDGVRPEFVQGLRLSCLSPGQFPSTQGRLAQSLTPSRGPTA